MMRYNKYYRSLHIFGHHPVRHAFHCVRLSDSRKHMGGQRDDSTLFGNSQRPPPEDSGLV